MENISFELISNRNGHIVLNVEDEIAKEILYFHLVPAITPNNELLAIALSTLCGNKYKNIQFNFDINEQIKSDIERFTNAVVHAKTHNNALNSKNNKSGHILSFSGGLDSLCAKCLMPDNTHLVSMDFGGRFARERKFFSQFDTCTVSTNLADTHLRKNNYLFMGIAAILFSDYTNSTYHTFGTIMEASQDPIININRKFPYINNYLSLQSAYYVYGLTEIGTAMVCLKSVPEIFAESCESVASRGENKKYRKQLIAKIVSDKTGVNIDIKDFNKPNIKLKYGDSFADDLLIFYFIKYAGLEATEKMIENIPESVVEYANKLSLNFFERINIDLYSDFPNELRADFYRKATLAGLQPYDGNDFAELRIVKELIVKNKIQNKAS